MRIQFEEVPLDVRRRAARAVAALVGDRQFFLTPTWVTTWLRWAAPAVTPHVLVARDGGGAVVGVLPLARRGRALELAGAAEGADPCRKPLSSACRSWQSETQTGTRSASTAARCPASWSWFWSTSSLARSWDLTATTIVC